MPTLANLNPSPAVGFEVPYFGVFAALDHGAPATVGPRLRLGVIMRPSVGISELGAGAAADGVAAAEPSDSGGFFGAAFTSNEPMCAASFHMGKADCSQMSEFLSGDVEPGHAVYSTTIMGPA